MFRETSSVFICNDRVFLLYLFDNILVLQISSFSSVLLILKNVDQLLDVLKQM